MKLYITMIDPPAGWKYGFPKPYPNGVENLEDWLLRRGYPQAEIDAGACGWCRYWLDEIDQYDLPEYFYHPEL